MAGRSDTSPEAERVLREALRRMPFARRWSQMGAIYNTARALHAAGLRGRQPAVADEEDAAAWRANVPGPRPPSDPGAAPRAAGIRCHPVDARRRLG